ncbi:MAG TPA: hypothetical protein VF468_21305 [Actinomycetota bacterium]|nr:hypothetical protein [Actinomycetota bacterium]
MQQNPMNPADTKVPVYDRGTGRSPWRDRLVAGVLCLVVGGAGGFALGRATASSGPATLAEAFQMAQEGELPQGDMQGPGGGQGFPGGPGGQGPGGQGPGGQGGTSGPSVQGDITSTDGDVLTISTQAGELKVQLSGSTEIRRAVAGKASDLAVGDTVSVRLDPAASNSSNGTVTASSVTEEPAQ